MLAENLPDQSAFALSGFGATAFAHFATMEDRMACLAVAREASEGWWARQGSNL
jgi:hypothetical protein